MSTVKKGYKKTKIGVIPEDWEMENIGQYIKFEGGTQPPKSTFKYEPTKGYIRLVQNRDFKTDRYKTYIPIEENHKVFNEDDIMIGRYGPPLFQIFSGLSGAYNVALIKATPKKGLYKKYCFYILKRPELRNYMEGLSQRSGGQTGIEMDLLNKYPLPLPPLSEQKKIAEILSTWDTRIEKQQELIMQKKKLKKGLMQQLLTGKKRFPQFAKASVSMKETKIGEVPEDWEITEISRISRIEMGQSPKSENYNSQGDGLVLIQGNGDIENRKTITRNWTTQVTKRSFEGAIIMSVRAPVGAIATQVHEEVVIGRGVASINSNRFSNQSFLYQLLLSQERKWIKYIQGSTFESINSKDIKNYKLPLPPLPEQKKIAGVLSEADSEIELLQKELEQMLEQKKGLMQKLLTGEVRVTL